MGKEISTNGGYFHVDFWQCISLERLDKRLSPIPLSYVSRSFAGGVQSPPRGATGERETPISVAVSIIGANREENVIVTIVAISIQGNAMIAKPTLPTVSKSNTTIPSFIFCVTSRRAPSSCDICRLAGRPQLAWNPVALHVSFLPLVAQVLDG